MVSLAILILFTAFYILFNTSKRAIKFEGFGFENYITKYPKQAKALGVFCMILSFVIHLLYFGVVSGALFFLINLMTAASVIVLLVPLKLINYKNVLILFFFSSLLEFFIL